MQNRLRTAAVVVAALALAVGTYLAYDKYTRRNHVVGMVSDAGARLHRVVQAQVGEAANVDLEAHATALEGYAATLRRMNTKSFTPLADAADDYLVTAREIARRSVEMRRARSALDASVPALSAHIKADRGAASWTGEAMKLKQTLDKDFRDYRLALEAYRSLLGTLESSQSNVAVYVEDLQIADAALIRQASDTALDAYFAAEQNVKRAADLGAYGRR